MAFFEKKLECDDELVEGILMFPVFLLKQGDEEEEEEHWNSFNLIPCEREGYSRVEELEYQYKMLCKIVANGDFEMRKKLYGFAVLSEIFEELGLEKARNYRRRK